MEKAKTGLKHWFHTGHWRFWLLLAFFGIMPALLIRNFLGIHDGQLVALGQNVGEGGAGRLLAAVLGTMQPLFFLLPFALCQRASTPILSHLGAVLSAVALLTLPSVLATSLVGGSDLKAALLGVLLLAALELNFLLWLRLLFSWLTRPVTYMLFAAAWAISGFVDYVSRYVLPYQDLGALKGLVAVHWLIPQVGTGFLLLDEVLTGQAKWLESFLPTFAQLPVLIILILFSGTLNVRK